ncbi:type II CRISPR-associated endonuclease Cas1, partial [Staphylococcus rostri]
VKYFLFSEIDAIIFDHPKCYLTQSLVVKCVENYIPIIFFDEKHSPITEVNMNFRSTVRLSRISLQLQMLGKTKDRIWKKIVMKKILNQTKCLENNLVYSNKVKELIAVAKEVSVGDRNNREALAARIYFQALYGNKFKRGRYDDLTNAGLNYGYAIIRSFIKTELVKHGFEMRMGIKHYSTENPFNLSDDIIEPYRPFIDNKVYEIINNKESESFGKCEKKKLLEVLHDKCIIDNKVLYLLDSIRITIQSLIQCYEKNSPTPLKLPQMIGVES